jgi:branched-chain amino acid transport system permease protein
MMTTVYAGLFAGSLYATVAIGFNIVFIATGTFNFAQAQYAMLGLWAAWIGLEVFHWNLLAVIVVGFAAGAVIGLVNERLAIRLLPSGTSHGELVTTVGFSVLIVGDRRLRRQPAFGSKRGHGQLSCLAARRPGLPL